MMKNQELILAQCQLCVGLSLVVGEFDLIRTFEQLHDGANLTADEAMLGRVRKEGDDIQQARCGVHFWRLHFTKQLVNRGAVSLRRTIHALLTTPEARGPLTWNSIT